VPGKPAAPTAAAGNGSASVSWTAPAANGSPITSYLVTSSPGGKTCSWASGPLSCTVSGLTNFTSYTFSVVATNAVGPSPASDPSAAVVPSSGATYYTVAPARALDSRVALGAGLFHSRVKQTVAIATADTGVPAAAVAVTGNVTIVPAGTTTTKTAAGFVTVAPTLVSGTEPSVSTINFPASDIRANGVTVPLASGGKLDFMYWASSSSATIDIVFDVTGYFLQGSGGATYHVLTPVRALDSRTPYPTGTTVFTSRVKQTVAIATADTGVPADAVAVTGNVTIVPVGTTVGKTAAGFVTVAPTLVSGTQPLTSTINFPASDTRANGVTVPLASGGKLDFMYWAGRSGPTLNVLFDVTGYFM